MKATRVIGLLVAVFMAAALFGGVVYAEQPDKKPPRGDGEPTKEIEHSDPYTRQSTGWTCEHDVHHPHNSGHFPGRINVEGETTCNVTMTNIIVTVQLQKKACLWFLCIWNTVAVTNPPETGQVHVEARANKPCEPGTYRGRINSTLIWPNGGSSFMYWLGESRTLDCD